MAAPHLGFTEFSGNVQSKAPIRRRLGVLTEKGSLMQRHLRLGAIVATSGLLAAGALPALPADAVTPPTQASAIAADWLAGQLTAPAAGGLVRNNGTPDYGSSIDAASALKAAGKDAAAQKAADAVVAVATAYTEYDATYSDGEYIGTYGGHVAKLLGLELDVPPTTAPPCDHYTPPAAGVSEPHPPSPATAQGTCELQDRLLYATDATTGQVQDTYSVTYSSTTSDHTAGSVKNGFGLPSDPQHTTQAGQAWAAYALAKQLVAHPTDTGLIAKAPLALSFLLNEQSGAGGFCVEQTATACTAPDVLTTAQVILALQQMPTADPITASINRAKAWLGTAQHSDGTFGDAVATGLAGAALGSTYGSQLAAVWLRQNQADELAACPDALSGSTGAVALTVQERNAGRAGGISDAARGNWERATTAAIAALNALPPRSASPVTFTGPSGFRRAGAVLTYDAANEAPGDLICVTSPTSLSRGWADINGHASVDAAMPNTTVDQPLTLHDHTGIDQQVVTRVLGPKRYSLSMVSHRKRGHLFRIRVYGLQPNENYYVKFRRTKFTHGRAPASGTVTVPYTIRRKAKIGKAKITVVGQTGDRFGVKYLRITR